MDNQIFETYLIDRIVHFLSFKGERMASQQAKIEPDKTVNNLKDDKRGSNSTNSRIPANVRQIYPEFLPAPRLEWRNTIREKIERTDMLNRRYIRIKS